MKVIFIPGNGGASTTDHWFNYIKQALEKQSIEVIASTFPDPDLAREKYWIPFLKDELKAGEDSILIGHSSGAIAAMRFAEQNKIIGSVLVGTYFTDLNDTSERESGYFDRPWNWEAIKHNQEWVIEFASSDDPFIPIVEPRFVRDKLSAEYYEYINEGHFHHKDTFPELVSALEKKLNK